MLEKWLQAAAAEAGVDDGDGAGRDAPLLSLDAVTVLLNLARDAAHGVARPAAPLATFAVGLAIGRTGGSLDDLRAAAERVATRADAWGEAGEPTAAE